MILQFTVSFLAVVGFGLALWRARVVALAQSAFQDAMSGLSSMMDSELDDNSKEIAVRRAGLRLISSCFKIFLKLLLALVIAALPILLFDLFGLVSVESVFLLMSRVDYIIAVSAVATVLAEIIRRRYLAADRASVKDNRYSATDRFFHMLAFSQPAVLKTASRIEDRILSKPLRAAPSTLPSPIFVTSLARAGTTALLNALYAVPGVATHTYRQMPFLTTPILWSKLSGGKNRQVGRAQRAHGDNLEIDLDSPEAFEEVLWRMFWPEKYTESSINLWDASDRNDQAEQFIRRHMSKVAFADQSPGQDLKKNRLRYCSKNNSNIARIPYLLETFPDCRLIVPIRRPECHAASLLRQHQNFLKLQQKDPFVLKYMSDIGHFEFGLNHKPIEFPGFDAKAYDTAVGDYWLNYWIHAYREIIRHKDDCIFVLQDDLRLSPQSIMEDLCHELDISADSMRFEPFFHAKPDIQNTDCYDPQLFKVATELYDEFRNSSTLVGLTKYKNL